MMNDDVEIFQLKMAIQQNLYYCYLSQKKQIKWKYSFFKLR